ncbi:uncharacterized protein E0L32_002417 [Thyridium curvatum]|uniref:Uncharacterized protein n=1 Tax=Thyridium curvatum TaxID=1093900 RepID=A0A507BP74_9PEZI|nr:uncharacterized protein E0L32_002417 [Thyridium curvatum]TPX18560.1 hypothetical protein E0L32_002417 [Thyridium curvatum]
MRSDNPRKILPLPTPANSTPTVEKSPPPSASRHGSHGSDDIRPLVLSTSHMDQDTSLPWFSDDSINSMPGLCLDWAAEFGNIMQFDTAASLDSMSQGEAVSISPLGHDGGSIDMAMQIPSAPVNALMFDSGTAGNAGNAADTEAGAYSAGYTPAPQSGQDMDQLAMFKQIMQPPAAMLMGGIRRWRHLQEYLLGLGSKNSAIMNALLCLEAVLAQDDEDQAPASPRTRERIADRYETARMYVIKKTSLAAGISGQESDELLALVYLLAWIRVIYDRGTELNEYSFPSEHAEIIITSNCKWNWYSRQLLSAFNSLDSKATHLGGPPLLSPKALAVVSCYPIQIVSCEYGEGKDKPLKAETDWRKASSVSDLSDHGDSATLVPSLTTADVKEIILRAILQPASEWYLQTQSYFRHIGSLDKHHRSRFTPDDELEVAVLGKQYQSELLDLWAQRPSAISLTAVDISKTLAKDVAVRLEEVFSVYLASYWVLFLYLHRVCWWHLEPTATVQMAADKTWDLLQQSYSELDRCKTVHPALMWPVFIFGAECSDEQRRKWAVEQIKGLARPRPVLELEAGNPETLPAFRLSRGATKNSKRAALLLEALIKRQEAIGTRVDERDLAMEMFGCHFSIV